MSTSLSGMGWRWKRCALPADLGRPRPETGGTGPLASGLSDPAPASSGGDGGLGTPAVTVYWRPGCPYCASLRRGLRRAGLVTTEVNIWTDRAAATTVRALAGGNETVPTVVVGDTPLVNPTAAEVLAIADGLSEAGALRTASSVAPLGSGLGVVQVAQWVIVVALVVASIAADGYGHAGVSWILDAAALTAYLVARVLRRRVERHGAP